MPSIQLSKDTFKYLKIIYKEYLKKLKSNLKQPNYFDNGNFNKQTQKLSEFTIRNSMSTLFNLDFTKQYTDGGFLLLDDGICYVETHSVGFKFKKWFSENLIPILALLVSFFSLIISIVSLLIGLTTT